MAVTYNTKSKETGHAKGITLWHNNQVL